MQPKLFLEQTLQSFLLVFLPFIFEYILSHVLTTLSIHENVKILKILFSQVEHLNLAYIQRFLPLIPLMTLMRLTLPRFLQFEHS